MMTPWRRRNEMAHTHSEGHGHDVVTRSDPGGFSAMMIALAVLIVAAVVALAVLWAQPWDDDNGSTPDAPGIGEQVPVPGEGDGGTDGGSGEQPQDGGGEAPAQ
jgi:hypothetical protein